MNGLLPRYWFVLLLIQNWYYVQQKLSEFIKDTLCRLHHLFSTLADAPHSLCAWNCLRECIRLHLPSKSVWATQDSEWNCHTGRAISSLITVGLCLGLYFRRAAGREFVFVYLHFLASLLALEVNDQVEPVSVCQPNRFPNFTNDIVPQGIPETNSNLSLLHSN